jgi:hypothetical protein
MALVKVVATVVLMLMLLLLVLVLVVIVVFGVRRAVVTFARGPG